MDQVITVERLRKTYGDLVAVDDVSFEVQRNELFNVCLAGHRHLGPNDQHRRLLRGMQREIHVRFALARWRSGDDRILENAPPVRVCELTLRVLQESLPRCLTLIHLMLASRVVALPR